MSNSFVNILGVSVNTCTKDEIIEKIEAESLSFSLKDLAINGHDLISLGYEGREIGKTLNFLLEAVLNGEVNNDKQALIAHLKNTR